MIVAGVNAKLCHQLHQEWSDSERVIQIEHTHLRSVCDFAEEDFKRVGIDRLLFVAGVSPLIKQESVCIDFGTYTTVNFVSEDAMLLGGWILPGLAPWVNSAKEPAPQLMVPIAPFSFLGKEYLSSASFPTTTQDTILSGFRQSYLGLFKQIVALACPIYVTGGSAGTFQKLLPTDVHRDDYWVERGMLEVAREL